MLRGLDVLQNPIAGATLHGSAFGSGGCTHLQSFSVLQLEGAGKNRKSNVLEKCHKTANFQKLNCELSVNWVGKSITYDKRQASSFPLAQAEIENCKLEQNRTH